LNATTSPRRLASDDYLRNLRLIKTTFLDLRAVFFGPPRCATLDIEMRDLQYYGVLEIALHRIRLALTGALLSSQTNRPFSQCWLDWGKGSTMTCIDGAPYRGANNASLSQPDGVLVLTYWLPG
jgi:hypothetical protein